MKVHLAFAISIGPTMIREVEVHLPPNGVDLARPPRKAEPVIWALTQITSLTREQVLELEESDANRLIDAYRALVRSPPPASPISTLKLRL